MLVLSNKITVITCPIVKLDVTYNVNRHQFDTLLLGIFYNQRALLMKKFVLAAAIASTLFLAGCSDKVDESTITNVVQTSQYEQPNLGITAEHTF